MADIVYRFEEMNSAASEIDGYVEQYKSAAQRLIDSLNAVTKDWEGETKEKYSAFINGPIFEHLYENIPQIVAALSSEIRMSSENMSQNDSSLADSIPTSLEG